MELSNRRRKFLKIPSAIYGEKLEFKVRYGHPFETISMIHEYESKNINVIGSVRYKIMECNSKKRFIIYTDNTLTSCGEETVYAGRYYPYSLIRKVRPIIDEKDWDIVQCFVNYMNRFILE